MTLQCRTIFAVVRRTTAPGAAPARRRNRETTLGYWFTIAGGDGFYAAQDPNDPNIVYGESQGGNASRLNLATGDRAGFDKPNGNALYKQWEDSIAIARGDPMQPETKAIQARVKELRAKQKADSLTLSIRYNWNTPFFLSPHNPSVVYYAGSKVMKSSKRGEEMRIISPDLSKQNAAKIDTSLRLTGGITLDATGAETYGTVVALEESPVRPGLLYAGTDDGNVWKTANDGATWENLSSHFGPMPNGGEVYVSRIEASAFDTNTVYVTFDNHRWGDFKPYAFVSNDGGKSFRSISNNLPVGGPGDFLHVIREDPHNRDLLFVGSSLSVYASTDRGATWTKFASNFPSVPVYDLQIHPRDHELIAATHGRGFWIVDIAPLEQMTTKVIAERTYLFEPRPAFGWAEPPTRGASGNGNAQGFFTTQNPTYGATISYRIAAGAGAQVAPEGGAMQQSGDANAGGNAGAVGAAAAGARAGGGGAGRGAGAGGAGGRGGRAGGGANGAGAGGAGAGGGGQPRGPQARISIVDVLGDTLQTITGPATAGLHTVTWAYNINRPAEVAELSPSERRDSVVRAVRAPLVLDSLTKANFDTTAISLARQLLAPPPPGGAASLFGGGRGGGGGGGGNPAGCERPLTMWEPFCPRAAEASPAPAGAGAAGGGGAGGRGAALLGASQNESVQRIFALIGIPIPGVGGGRGGFGGFGRGGSAMTGDYSVVLQVNGVTLKQKLRLENTSIENGFGGFGNDDESRDRDR